MTTIAIHEINGGYRFLIHVEIGGIKENDAIEEALKELQREVIRRTSRRNWSGE